MLRGIRFANQLRFEIEEKSLQSIAKNKDRINIITGERIVDELNKILSTDKPSIGFLHPETNSTAPPILPWSVIAAALNPISLALVAYLVGEGKASWTEK
jgi:tRNA nucleotidyltransferase/poly(A) polymerase